MNPLAVTLGIIYGLVTAGTSYVVSMLASGLFTRTFYRIYARVLIGICSAMLLVPLLRWFSPHPLAARMLLTATNYAAMAVLGYGVVRFNREFMKSVFLERQLTAYFTFGTLVNAALVTGVFLHIAVAVRAGPAETDHISVGPEHYGPFVMLLAAMIFHTDYYLKRATDDARHFSKFTFVGYAVSFVAILISTLPYFGRAFAALGLSHSLGEGERAFLENFSCAQTLLLAIVIYGAMVWYLESIPPLYMLLLALCGEYHLLVTQWFIEGFGAASWGLASLPLFVGMSAMAQYFMRWDRKRAERESRREGTSEVAAVAEPESPPRPRFVVPFLVVTWGLAVALIGLTLWTRFAPSVTAPSLLRPATWLAVTFVAYAIYFFVTSILQKDHRFIYAGAAVASLAALFGWDVPASALSAVSVAGLSFSFAGLAWVGRRVALKREFRTALSDSALALALFVVAIVLCRHVSDLGHAGPYRFHHVNDPRDAVALFFSVVAFAVCARQYGSRLPMYGAVLAIVVVAPTLSAASSFLAYTAAAIIRRRVSPERAGSEDERLSLLARFPLPLKDRLPSLYALPLSAGALPLSLLGLTFSAWHIFRGDLLISAPPGAAVSALLGAAVSALVLGLITRIYPFHWVLALSILSGYFAIHAAAQRVFFVFFSDWAPADAISGHLAISAAISLFGWAVACGYSAWSEFWLKRVAEAKEAAIRERHVFYSGMLHHVTLVVATATLGLLMVMSLSLRGGGIPGLLLASALISACFFGLSGAVYRSKLGSYLSLTATALGAVILVQVIDLPEGTEGTLLAALGLVMALISAGFWGKAGISELEGRRQVFPSPWDRSPLPLAAVGMQLWLRPLAEFALLFGGLGFVHSLWVHAEGIFAFNATSPPLITFGLTTLILLLCTRAYRVSALYILAILSGYFAIHAAAHRVRFAGQLPGEYLPEVVSGHVLLAAILSLLGWAIATAYSAWCNSRLARVAEEEEAAIKERRAYYAGLLHHVTLAVACVTIVLLFALPTLAPHRGVIDIAVIRLGGGNMLAIFFALSGATYRSRLQSYLSLAAMSLACYVAVGLFDPNVRSPLFGAGLGSLALILGALSKGLLRYVPASPVSGAEFGRGRVPTPWERPPLPLVAAGAELWAQPLAQVSVLLGFVAVAFAGLNWQESDPAWNLVAFYLAAAVWLLGTATYRLGILRPFAGLESGTAGPGDVIGPEQTDRLERIALYVLTIGTGYFALHATAQTLLPSDRPFSEVVSWHALVAAVVSLVGWSIATGYSAWCNSLLARIAKEEEPAIRDRLAFYAGLLHHVILVIATLDLIVLFSSTVQQNVRGAPPALFVAGLLLAIFFGLSGAVYQSKVGTYLALISLGLFAVDVVALPWNSGGPADAASLALVALFMAVIATVLERRPDASSPGNTPLPILPSPWSHAPLPLGEATLRRLWAKPLAELTLVFSGLAVLLAAMPWDRSEGAPILATFYCTAASFILAARLYRTPVLTYIAAAGLWASVYPMLVLLIESHPFTQSETTVLTESHPFTQSGTAVAALSLALWGASYFVERRVRASTAGETREGDTSPPPIDLVTVFERPLGRCAGMLAVIAVAHSLLVWRIEGWKASHGTLVVACVGGAITLLLSARTMKITQRISRARVFVYLGCAALAGGCLAVVFSVWGPDDLGPVLAALSLLMCLLGVVLIERAAAAEAAETGAGGLRQVYGEPILHSALALPVLAIVLAVVNSLPQVIEDIARLANPARLGEGDTVQNAIDAVNSDRLWDASLGQLAATLLITSAVYLVSVRATRERNWLYPSVILGSLGILVLSENTFQLHSGLFILTTVVLMNLLVVAARWIERNEARVSPLLGIPGEGCARPFYQWPSVVTAAVVLGQGVFFCLTLLDQVKPRDPNWPWAVTPVLSCALFLHLFYLERRRDFVHVLIGSSLLGLLGAAASSHWLVTPDIAVAVLGLLWGIVAGGLASPRGDRVLAGMRLRMDWPERTTLSQATAAWSVGLLVFALAVTIPTWTHVPPVFPSTGLTLLLVTVGLAVGGYVWRRVELEAVAAVLFLASIGTTLVFYRADQAALEMLPIAGLVTIVLSAAYVAVSRGLMTRSASNEPDTFIATTGRSLGLIAMAFTALGAIGSLLSVLRLQPSIPVAVTMGLICACWLFMAWHFKREPFVYLAEAALACTFLYVRHAILDAPLGPDLVKAFGVVGLCFLLFGINIVVARGEASGAGVFVRPTYYSALFLPLALLGATPWADKSATSLVLFAAGAFYMLVARRARALWAIYLAAVLVNVALYIWIPTAHDRTHLFQLYVIPAALTVLIFANLHRNELNRQSLTAIRMAASAAILAVSTFEVFFSANQYLLHFVVVLFLSLIGTAAGVALRVRPFVYVGLAFLVINVVGQLGMQIHSQGGIVRAVILIAVGFAVMGMMIFFNIKRQALLRQYRSFLGDTRWE